MELAPGERPVEAGALAPAGGSHRHDAVAAASWALALWLCWTAATYLLEGRVLTLTRPEDTGARILYSVVANLLIGTAGSVYVLRRLFRKGVLSPQRSGFSAPRRTLLAVGAATVLGSVVYAAQGPPTLDPVVLVNVYAQVLAVSVAEVLVCWSVIGGTVEALTRRFRRRGTLVAALAAAVLFGAYHFAHSPPFNTVGAVVLLSVVGLVTGRSSSSHGMSTAPSSSTTAWARSGCSARWRGPVASGRTRTFEPPSSPPARSPWPRSSWRTWCGCGRRALRIGGVPVTMVTGDFTHQDVGSARALT